MQIATATRRPTGRPWLGPRHRLSVKLPLDEAEAVQAVARARGTTVNDLLASLLRPLLDAEGDRTATAA